MPALNKVLLMGNLTRDPELRVTPKGTPICQFTLACNRDYKTESGERREETAFIDIESWGKQGETIAKYVKKGHALYVEGRLKQDTWEDKETKQKRSKLKVVCEGFQFLTKQDAAPQQSQSGLGFDAPPAPPAQKKPIPAENLDEDVPF